MKNKSKYMLTSYLKIIELEYVLCGYVTNQISKK